MHLSETSSHGQVWVEHFCAVTFPHLPLFLLVTSCVGNVCISGTTYGSRKWLTEDMGCISQLLLGNKPPQLSATYTVSLYSHTHRSEGQLKELCFHHVSAGWLVWAGLDSKLEGQLRPTGLLVLLRLAGSLGHVLSR